MPRKRRSDLRQRNATLLTENRRLRDQIAELKTELAIAYGQQRAAN
jgi:cell division septum initiation protein DivIVA